MTAHPMKAAEHFQGLPRAFVMTQEAGTSERLKRVSRAYSKSLLTRIRGVGGK